jgi:hypothetical protein
VWRSELGTAQLKLDTPYSKTKSISSEVVLHEKLTDCVHLKWSFTFFKFVVALNRQTGMILFRLAQEGMPLVLILGSMSTANKRLLRHGGRDNSSAGCPRDKARSFNPHKSFSLGRRGILMDERIKIINQRTPCVTSFSP